MKKIIAVLVFLSFFGISLAITGCSVASIPLIGVKALQLQKEKNKNDNDSKGKRWDPGCKCWVK